MVSNRSNNKNLLLLFALSAFYILYYHICRMLPYNNTGLIHGHNFNVAAYVLSVVGGFCLFAACWGVSRKKSGTEQRQRLSQCVRRICTFLAFLLPVCVVVYLILVYRDEYKLPASDVMRMYFIREQVPHALAIFVMSLLFAVIVTVIVILRADRSYRWIRPVLAVVIAGGCALLNYGPNTFQNPLLGIYHNHAVTATIVGIAKGEPLDFTTTPIYGHYGLIYYPFVKLFGNNEVAIAVTIAFFTFVLEVCAFYTLSGLIRNNVVYVLTVLAVAGTSTTYYRPCQALAVMPTRYLFPLITLAYITWCVKHPEKSGRSFRRTSMGIMIGTLAVTFNIESAVSCLAMIAVFEFFLEPYCDWQIVLLKRSIVCRTLVILLKTVLCFACSYLIILMYNLLSGGGLVSLQLFAYPLLGGGYNINSITTLPFPTTRSGYILHLVVFSFASFYGIFYMVERLIKKTKHIRMQGKDYCDRLVVAMCVGICGLILLTYFMNRTAMGNLSLTHIPFVILVGYYADGAAIWLNTFKKKRSEVEQKRGEHIFFIFAGCNDALFRFLMSLICLYLISWFAWEGIFSISSTIREYRADSLWNVAQLQTLCSETKQRVPKDTLAFGIGMPELYYQLGWDEQIPAIDWTDMPSGAMEVVKRAVDQENSFLMTDGTAFEDADFELTDQFGIQDYTLNYYQRKQ